MSESQVCASCGVTFPSFEKVCAACGRKVDRFWKLWRVATLAAGLCLIVAMGIVAYRRHLQAMIDPLSSGVIVIPGGHHMAVDGRGTDISGTIINSGLEPVDVWIRLRGYDVRDRPCTEEVIGPFRNIRAGAMHTYSYRVPATPIQRFDHDLSSVQRSAVDSSP